MVRKTLIAAAFAAVAACAVSIAASLATPTRECPYCPGTATLYESKRNSASQFDKFSCLCGGRCWDRTDLRTGAVEHFPKSVESR